MRQAILIMCDTQRTDMVGCYGSPGLKTPNIDALAERGVRFNRAYTTQPVCGPARSAIFTGLFPHSNGVVTNSVSLYDNVKTIGQRLKDQSFHTGYIGKWHLDGSDYFGLGRCPDGWDEKYWYDMRNYMDELTEEERVKSRSEKTMDGEDIAPEFTFAHRCSDRAIDFLKNSKDEDFFLVLSYDEPHDPYLCPQPYASMYKDFEFPKSLNIYDDLKNKPDYQRVWAGDSLHENKNDLKISPAYFLGCNSYMDYQLGRVTEAISHYAPDALIIYTSDHGDFLSSHSLSGKGPAAYDEITRIPLIMAGNGVEYIGCNDHPVSHIDIVPTILDYMNLPVPKALEGRSLLPALKEENVHINNYVFMEFTRYEIDHDGFGGFQPLRSVFDGRFKLTVNLLSTDELYDLKGDPGELDNLIYSKEHYEIRNKLHDVLLDHMNNTRDLYRGYYWERRPWREDAKNATWAYTGYTRQRENDEYEPRQLVYETGLTMDKAVRRKLLR